jgi:hypothetical protein
VTEHLHELGDEALLGQSTPLYGQTTEPVGGPLVLEPKAGVQSFHMRLDQRQVIQQVFRAFGLQATVDDTVHPQLIRMEMDSEPGD